MVLKVGSIYRNQLLQIVILKMIRSHELFVLKYTPKAIHSIVIVKVAMLLF